MDTSVIIRLISGVLFLAVLGVLIMRQKKRHTKRLDTMLKLLVARPA